MLSVVCPCYTGVLPSLEIGYGRIKPCLSRGYSIRKNRPFIVLARRKPPFNIDGGETNDETSSSELPTIEGRPQTSDFGTRTRSSVWARLPVVGSWFGGQKVAYFKAESTEIKWGGILDPTPDNLLALLLTGLLGLAALQIFWQLFLVAITITLAALKYSVIAAILLTLLIIFL